MVRCSGEVYGFKYWKDPGAFSHGVLGVINALVLAALTMTGTDIVGVSAGESANPRKVDHQSSCHTRELKKKKTHTILLGNSTSCKDCICSYHFHLCSLCVCDGYADTMERPSQSYRKRQRCNRVTFHHGLPISRFEGC